MPKKPRRGGTPSQGPEDERAELRRLVKESPVWSQMVVGAQRWIEDYYLDHFERQRQRKPTFFASSTGTPELHLRMGGNATVLLREAMIAFRTRALIMRDPIARHMAPILEALVWASYQDDPRMLKVPHAWANGRKGGVLPDVAAWKLAQAEQQGLLTEQVPSAGSMATFLDRVAAANQLLDAAKKLSNKREPKASIIRALLMKIASLFPDHAASAVDQAALDKVNKLIEGNAKWSELSEETPEELVRIALRIAGYPPAKIKNFFEHKARREQRHRPR
jgi:hypothetical protein